MEFLLFVLQSILIFTFSITLWCEVSKNYTDNFMCVTARLIIMLYSCILFFKIGELTQVNNYLMFISISVISIFISYVIYNKVLPMMKLTTFEIQHN